MPRCEHWRSCAANARTLRSDERTRKRIRGLFHKATDALPCVRETPLRHVRRCLPAATGEWDKGAVPLSHFCASRNGGVRGEARFNGARGSGALFCGEGGGVRERCSRVEGGLSPKALAKPPSTREVGRAARRSPACCAREVPVPALAAGRQGACAPAARKPRQRARAAGGKSCSNGVAAGQATTRFSPA